MPAHAEKIWVPESHNHDRKIRAIQRVLSDYDDRLVFARNEITGDWCIFVKMPPSYAPAGIHLELWPAIGFGNEIPEPDYALHRLRMADSLRQGDALAREAERTARSQYAAMNAAAAEGESIAAEGMESFMHRIGKTPYHRSLRKRDPKQRSTS